MADDGAWLPRGLPDTAVMPRRCACCGDTATHGTRERRPLSTFAVVVPYCVECHRHASAESTRLLAVSVAAALVAVTLTAGLPLILGEDSLPLYGALVVAGGAVPLGVSWLRRGAALPGHATAGRAVYFRPDGTLVCRSESFARELAAAGGGQVEPGRTSGVLATPWAVAVLAACAVAVWPAHRFHFPVVRIVNTTGEPLAIAIDGEVRGRVPSTARESELSGVEFRVPAGERRFQAFDPAGSVVDATTVEVEAGAMHLYAPASNDACFRIETTGFGRRTDQGTSSAPLTGPPYFWVLPSGSEGIDYWFAPAPPPAADSRSTGGLVRALRQGPCPEMR